MSDDAPDTEPVDYIELILRASRDQDIILLAAKLILQAFDGYHARSEAIPWAAKRAFEGRDYALTLRLGHERLTLWSESIRAFAQRLKRVFPLLSHDEHHWDRLERRYLKLIRGRYEEDLAMAYVHSARRMIYDREWTPVDYAFARAPGRVAAPERRVLRRIEANGPLDGDAVERLLDVPGLEGPWRDRAGDALKVARRVNRTFGAEAAGLRAVLAVEAGFYRNRGVYIVARAVLAGGARPLVLSLENGEDGFSVDAVLLTVGDVHNIFSSTLATFHVTNPHYHELAAFLHGLMPTRPLALHYATIGFHHVGKVAVVEEVRKEIERSGERLRTAAGFKGTVAIGFSAPSSGYVLKLVRDHPTEGYKWGHFAGIDDVLGKYRQVHTINRTGSMLDNIIYHNIRLDRAWFEEDLLDELVRFAGKTVRLKGDAVIFRHLIVQMKMIPLPIFLEKADPDAAAAAVVNLGHCIKNNAAADIFNKDLDGRNYGVSPFLKVFLFDYDAIEPFTTVKIRTNADRIEGEEDVPDWVFEDGFIFLPEEIEAGLRIDDRNLRRLFRAHHGDLLTLRWWRNLQEELEQGRVPRIAVYPDSCRIGGDADGDGGSP
ncbi:MAG: bifunctional isocitrate dehydrogenase kinase/phosphatase [Geminicoccaceae bacterium]|nr:bifunctional isocitrate dehydrogenase kinase/phosphatase [Geminicoccaceae bacterium]